MCLPSTCGVRASRHAQGWRPDGGGQQMFPGRRVIYLSPLAPSSLPQTEIYPIPFRGVNVRAPAEKKHTALPRAVEVVGCDSDRRHPPPLSATATRAYVRCSEVHPCRAGDRRRGPSRVSFPPTVAATVGACFFLRARFRGFHEPIQSPAPRALRGCCPCLLIKRRAEGPASPESRTRTQ